MRVLVCGGRDYKNWATITKTLDALTVTLLIHGAAPGADTLASVWACTQRVPQLPFPLTDADWERLGKKAGPMRNARMLTEGKPDLVVAFPGGKGTADMVRQAGAVGVRVMGIKS